MPLFGAALGSLACDEGPEIVYEGSPGTPVPARFDGLVPTVEVRLDGAAPRPFLVDTGAPLTIVDATAYPGLADGAHRQDLEAFGLRFTAYPTVSWDLFGDAADAPAGLVGGDLLRHFALSLDYQGQAAWLSDAFDPAAPPPVPVAAEPAASVPFALLGGGAMRIPGDCPGGTCGVVAAPPTRIALEARVEGRPEPIGVVVDTGASAVVLSPELYAELAQATPGRPVLEGITVSVVDGEIDALMTRVWRLALAGPGEHGPSAALDDVPVLVLPGSTLFDAIRAEVGHDVHALVGGSWLRWFWTTIDYPAERLHLARYANPTHVPRDEFVGVGFVMDPVGDEWIVADVYDGTDAAAEGLVRGDVIEQIGAMPIGGQPPEIVADLMDDYALGQEVPVGVRRAAGVETRMVLVEDLLPSFPPPP